MRPVFLPCHLFPRAYLDLDLLQTLPNPLGLVVVPSPLKPGVQGVSGATGGHDGPGASAVRAGPDGVTGTERNADPSLFVAVPTNDWDRQIHGNRLLYMDSGTNPDTRRPTPGSRVSATCGGEAREAGPPLMPAFGPLPQAYEPLGGVCPRFCSKVLPGRAGKGGWGKPPGPPGKKRSPGPSVSREGPVTERFSVRARVRERPAGAIGGGTFYW